MNGLKEIAHTRHSIRKYCFLSGLRTDRIFVAAKKLQFGLFGKKEALLIFTLGGVGNYTSLEISSNMRHVILSAISIIGLNIFFSQSGYSQSSNRLLTAIIAYEDFATSTVEDVHCEFFEATFPGTIKRVVVKDGLELRKLALYANDFKIISSKPIDVRVLFTFINKGRNEAYCMDRWGTFVNKKTGKYYSNKLLSDFILKRCR